MFRLPGAGAQAIEHMIPQAEHAAQGALPSLAGAGHSGGGSLFGSAGMSPFTMPVGKGRTVALPPAHELQAMREGGLHSMPSAPAAPDMSAVQRTQAAAPKAPMPSPAAPALAPKQPAAPNPVAPGGFNPNSPEYASMREALLASGAIAR